MKKDKTKDMIRSILPSTHRRYARFAKAYRNRQARHAVDVDVRRQNLDADLHRSAYFGDVVSTRRGGDKLNHFMRWCEAITKGMTVPQALEHVRAMLPDSLIGDHAYGHWELHLRYRLERYPTYWERGGRRVQSFVDSTTFRLQRALNVDPTLHSRLNAEIKRRKPAGEPRRLLAGTHDVNDFARAIAKSLHAAAQYWRDDYPDPFRIERETTLELIEQIERQKGGRKGRPSSICRRHKTGGLSAALIAAARGVLAAGQSHSPRTTAPAGAAAVFVH